ncbi:MAG: LCP family protein [Acidimicrobiia bacterium]
MRKLISRLAIALVLTTILSASGIMFVNRLFDERYKNLKRKTVNVATDTGSTEPANFLLIGSDTRSFVKSQKDKNAFTDSQGETGQRSDTMMIIHVDPKDKKTTVLAIPRDTQVQIPGIGKQKINASFNADLGGGPDKVIETIKANFDISIQHYVELDFDTFRKVVKALGSVNVYFPAPARDKKSGLDTKMKSGCIALDGDGALSYVRSRYYEQYVDGKWQQDPTSNYGRIARQQEFMKRVATIAVKKSLADPLKGKKVSDAIIENLQVDQNLKKDDIFKLMNTFNKVDPNDPNHVVFETLPVKSKYINGVSYDLIQSSEAEPMLEVFRDLSSHNSSSSTTTLPKPSTVKVRVLNSSNRKGLAATAMNDLQEIGFVTAGTGNATGRTSTEIHYTQANKAKALLVAKYVNGTLIQDTSIADADIVVMLGTEFEKVDTAGKAQVTTTTKAANSTSTTKSTSKPSINGVSDSSNCPA